MSASLHLLLVKSLDAAALRVPHPQRITLLHLGCGVPTFLRESRAMAAGRVIYRGVEADEVQVRAAAAAMPGRNFIWRDLLTLLHPAADFIIVGPGVFRLDDASRATLMDHLAAGTWSTLALATPSGARPDVPLFGTPPQRTLTVPGAPCAYAIWNR